MNKVDINKILNGIFEIHSMHVSSIGCLFIPQWSGGANDVTAGSQADDYPPGCTGCF